MSFKAFEPTSVSPTKHPVFSSTQCDIELIFSPWLTDELRTTVLV